MIRTKREYDASKKKLKQNDNVIKKQLKKMQVLKLSKKEIKIAMAPMVNFRNQLEDEIKIYEEIKACKWSTIRKLFSEHAGRFLIALRIARKLTQRELAKLLGVTEAQVSKNERNVG